MSAAEMAWRFAGLLRDRLDMVRYPLRRSGWLPKSLTKSASLQSEDQAHYLLDGWAGRPGLQPETLPCEWKMALLRQADQVAAGRLSFFDLQDVSLGDPVNWNRDHKLGLNTPLTFAPAIDYRDVRAVGDCKFVWEPSRHHQLVVLGRAYRITGRQEYARAIINQMESWIDQCPFGQGMQWRSPLELAIRLINWTFALTLIRGSDLLTGEFTRRVRKCIYLHLWDITRKYSRHSSANNHTIGEAAGVYIATACMADLPGSRRWRREAKDILQREIQRQTRSDGGGGEQAIGYHLFVCQFFLLAGLVGRRGGDEFCPAYWRRLEQMFAFLAALMAGGGSVPAIGDGDDGYVLDLGQGPNGYREWLSAAAVAFDRRDFGHIAGMFSQTAWWLFGPSGSQRFGELCSGSEESVITSAAFPETGLYVVQSGSNSRRMSMTFDCGSHGLEPLNAHGHADALSITLRVNGVDVLVDPGTYDYFSYRPWREYFRGTSAHNTIEIDGQPQSEPVGLFMWGRRARSRCLSWSQDKVVGEHDGYCRLPDPVIHRRSLTMNTHAREVCVQDDILADGEHEVALWFHFAEQCRINQLSPNAFEIDAGAASITLALDRRLAVKVFTGSESPMAGWVSRGYHRKNASTSVLATCRTNGRETIRSILNVH